MSVYPLPDRGAPGSETSLYTLRLLEKLPAGHESSTIMSDQEKKRSKKYNRVREKFDELPLEEKATHRATSQVVHDRPLRMKCSP